MEFDRLSLEEWQRYQPLSVLRLDIADRAVLRIAGTGGGWIWLWLGCLVISKSAEESLT